MNAGNSAARGKHALRVLGWLCLSAAVIVPFLAALLWDLQTAANAAQLASIPLTAAGLLGISLLPKAPDQPATAPGAPSGTAQVPTTGSASVGDPPSTPRPPARTGRKMGQALIFRYLGIGAGLLLGASSVVVWLFSSSSYSGNLVNQGDKVLVHQPLVVVDGLRPVPFDGGTIWRWGDLKAGTITVTMSPGGGSKNDGLRQIGGTIDTVGSCSGSMDNYVRWSFKADGRSLDMLSVYGPTTNIELPDHVDLLTLQMTVAVRDGCTIGLSWNDPTVVRVGPIPG
jgi:hypothetical protein